MGRRLSIPPALPVLIGILSCAPLWAQPTSDPAEVAPSPPQAETAPLPGDAATVTPAPAEGDVIYVQRDGRWVAAPAGEVFSAQSASPADDGEREPAPVYISSLSLDGDVVGDYAEMTARIGIEITQPDQWQDVPLSLHQAHVYEPAYEGDGEAVPATGLPPEEGVHWLIRGKGSHRLQLKFRLPVKSSPAGVQLQLTLPALPSGFYARAVLRVAGHQAVLRGTVDGLDVRRRELEGGRTEFDCDVSGTRWDLSWRNQADEQPIVSQTSYLRLGRVDGELRLEVRQQCDVSRGQLTELKVRLPSGFTLRDVERRQGLQRDRLMWSPIDGREGWIRVPLSPPAEVEDSLELNWRLSRPFPTEGGMVVLDGLELEGTGSHTGTIEIESVEGHALSPPTGQSRGVYQKSTTEPRSGGPSILRAFEFQSLPYVLEFEIAPVPPRVSAAAHNYLWLGPEQDELYVWTELTVESGQVSELAWEWPGWAAAGWAPASTLIDVTVLTGDATEVVRGTIEMPDADAEQLRLSLSRPCSGRMRILLAMNRPVELDSGGLEFVAARPALEYSARTGTLSIAGDRRLEIQTDSDPAAAAATDLPALPAGVPSAFGGSRVQSWAIGPSTAPITVQRTEHQRTVRASATVTVSEISRTSVRVVEEIDYEVRHGEISSLLLQLPGSLVDEVDPGRNGASTPFADVGVEFRISHGDEFTAERTGDQVRLQLSQPAQDAFRLTVDFVLPLPTVGDGEVQQIVVPFVRSLDADFTATLLRIESPATLRLATNEPGWTFRTTRSGVPAWVTSQQPGSAVLSLDESLLRAPQQFTVDTAFVRTWIDDAGESRTEAEYLIRNAPGRIFIQLPSQASNVELRWNGAPLAAGTGVRPFSDLPDAFIIERPEDDASAAGRLQVRYRRRNGEALRVLARTRLDFPDFGDSVAVTETLCEIVLPPGHQLSEAPAGLAPQYEWQRESVIWMRRSTAEYRTRRDQLGIEPIAQRGNLYAFSTYGPVRAASFGSMAQSVIVLLGAGLTLLLGFAFGRIPATRNVLSVLVLGFVFALLSLWHLELMQLLLQPALLGLLLASVAAAFDAATRRRRGVLIPRDGSSLSRMPGVREERRSSIHGSGPAAAARTALYQAEAGPQSGGTP